MTTTKLGLTETANGQANYLNVNTALSRLDQLVFARVVDRDLSAPPGSPANGAMYIPAATATGAWAGKENNLAWWLTDANQWFFLAPAEGMGLVYVLDEDEFIYHNGTAWTVFSGGGGGATDAADVSIADAGGYFSSSDVEGALQELGAASAPSLTNPMRTAGDIIVGGKGGTPERLAKGTDGQVLKMVSGSQAWAAESGGGYIDKRMMWGLRMVWVSGSSIKIEPGAAYLASTAAQIELASDLTISPTITGDQFYHLYIYDNSGTASVECVTTAPASYSGPAMQKTGDNSRRYIGSVLVKSGAFVNFLHIDNEVFYRAGQDSSPFRVVSGAVNTTEASVSISSVLPVSAKVAKLRIISTSTAGIFNVGVPEDSPAAPVGLIQVDPKSNVIYSMPCESRQITYAFSAAGGPTAGAGYVDVHGYSFFR
ncbi:DUF2793 domain-containing protein [Pseudomonas sp. S9]|uniref:DUF2793 domain-containing protein n=1 Tax=Pseudomonas sp. S9 TaxID=686578 RepID=UPI0002556F5B|nr:DUF2793 domain-containing protein [Pseudomonas sp. S9]